MKIWVLNHINDAGDWEINPQDGAYQTKEAALEYVERFNKESFNYRKIVSVQEIIVSQELFMNSLVGLFCKGPMYWYYDLFELIKQRPSVLGIEVVSTIDIAQE